MFFNSWALSMCRYSIVTCFSIFAYSPPLFHKCFHPFFLLSCIFSVEYVPLFFLEVVDFPRVIQGRTVKRFYEITKNYFELCIFINLNSEESLSIFLFNRFQRLRIFLLECQIALLYLVIGWKNLGAKFSVNQMKNEINCHSFIYVWWTKLIPGVIWNLRPYCFFLRVINWFACPHCLMQCYDTFSISHPHKGAVIHVDSSFIRQTILLQDVLNVREKKKSLYHIGLIV